MSNEKGKPSESSEPNMAQGLNEIIFKLEAGEEPNATDKEIIKLAMADHLRGNGIKPETIDAIEEVLEIVAKARKRYQEIENQGGDVTLDEEYGKLERAFQDKIHALADNVRDFLYARLKFDEICKLFGRKDNGPELAQSEEQL